MFFPMIKILWFVVSNIMVGAVFIRYINYLLPFHDFDMLFYLGFASLNLSFLVCIIAFVFIQRDLIGPIPLIIFILLWTLIFGFLSYVVLQNLSVSWGFRTYFKSPEDPILQRFHNNAKIPQQMQQYQAVHKCCIFRDFNDKMLSEMNLRHRKQDFSCCSSIVKQCNGPRNWNSKKCLPLLHKDYELLAITVAIVGCVEIFLLVVLLIIYLLIVREDRIEKRQEEESEGNGEDKKQDSKVKRKNVCLCMCEI